MEKEFSTKAIMSNLEFFFYYYSWYSGTSGNFKSGDHLGGMQTFKGQMGGPFAFFDE